MIQAARPVRPKITYGEVLGKIIEHRRKQLELTQEPFAQSLGITQSGYSRIEKGFTAVSVLQLQAIAAILHSKPAILLNDADRYAELLRAQGAEIVTDRKDASRGAFLIALGFLVALLASSS